MATGIQTGMRSLKSRGKVAAEPTVLQRGIDFFRKLDRSWKLALLGLALIAGAGWTAGVQAYEAYAPVSLYSFDLQPDSVQEIALRLTELGVDHRLDETLKKILVEPGAAPSLRLALASEGLPSLEDRVQEPAGMVGPDNEERRRLQYAALERELAQSVRRVSGVADASVKLVPAENTYFVDNNRPATASVFLKLRGGQKLSGKQVEGITHLVAFSVPQLAPEKVKIVDQDGNVLVAQGQEDEFERGLQYQLEGHQVRVAQDLLDRVLGPDRAVVALNTEFDFSEVEIKRSDVGGPGETMVVLGKQRKEERYTKEEGSDYETIAEAHKTTADHSFVWTVHKTPRIKRLTVSLAVDNLQPQAAAKAADLVKGAVGFDESRGDYFALASVPFAREAAEPVPEPVPAAEASSLPSWPLLALGGGLMMAMAWALGRFSRPPVPELSHLETLPAADIKDLGPRETAINSCRRIEAMARERPDSVAKMLASTWLSS